MRKPMPGIPSLDSMHFLQRTSEETPGPFYGLFFGGPDLFLRDCQTYFSSLSEPKPTEGQFIRFITSRFCDPAREWVRRVAAMRPGVLENAEQFLEKFLEVFGEPGWKYKLDKVLRKSIRSSDAVPLFHEYYAQVRLQEKLTAQPAKSPFPVTSPIFVTSPILVRSPVPTRSPVSLQSQVSATSQAPVTATTQTPVTASQGKKDSGTQRKEMPEKVSKMQLEMEDLCSALSERESQLQATQVLLQEETLRMRVTDAMIGKLEGEQQKLLHSVQILMAEKDEKLDQVCEMEAELEDEGELRAQAVAAKEQLEMDLAECKARLIQAIETQVTAQGQLTQVQTQLKDQLREMGELRVARDMARSSANESERQVKSLAAEKEQLQEELSAVCRQEQVLQDRDELHEEVTGCYSKIA